MREKLQFLGMDVHAQTIAVAEPSQMAKFAAWVRLLTAKSRSVSLSESLARLSICVPAMKPVSDGICSLLAAGQSGVDRAVVAPSLAPTKPGDR